jgi:chemotaxis protein CheD
VNEIKVRIADYAVGRSGACLVTIGLGSCVAIILYDAVRRLGSLAHCLLPDDAGTRSGRKPARYPGTIVPVMVRELRELGAGGHLTARLVGGASMFRSLIESPSMNVGARNIAAARKALRKAGIRITGEDVGGESGRSVRFYLDNGEVVVRTVRGGERVI